MLSIKWLYLFVYFLSKFEHGFDTIRRETTWEDLAVRQLIRFGRILLAIAALLSAQRSCHQSRYILRSVGRSLRLINSFLLAHLFRQLHRTTDIGTTYFVAG